MSGQIPIPGKYSISLSFQPNLQIKNFLRHPGSNDEKGESYKGNNYGSGFPFSTGLNFEYQASDWLNLNTGLTFLKEQYAPDYKNGGSHDHPTYTLYKYSADYLRIPLGFRLLFNHNSKLTSYMGASANFDILVQELVYYDRSNPVDKKGLFIFDRIVPEIETGIKGRIFQNFFFRYQITYTFISTYQNAHREFYFKNHSIGMGLALGYTFNKKKQ